MEKKEIRIWYSHYPAMSDLVPEQQKLMEAAAQACKLAYAPYSGFYVGAALLLQDGSIVKGNNQENAAYPSGTCAERVAAWAAKSNHPGSSIQSIAVVSIEKKTGTINPVTPCGACRQVLLEYEKQQGSPIQVLLYSSKGRVMVFDRVADLLPLQFDSDALK